MNAIVTIGTDVAKNVFAVHRSVGHRASSHRFDPA